MRITRHPNSPIVLKSALTIGNFDGVHIGHIAILKQLVTQAKQRKLIPTVMTFEPHPKVFFAKVHGEKAPCQILPFRDKLTLLAAHGIEHTVVLPFNKILAQMPALDFATELLINRLNMHYLLIGDDFHFGAQRTGNFSLLKTMSNNHGFALQTHESVLFKNERISSSKIRQTLQEGNLSQINSLLGRPLTLSGRIIYGQQLGRTINCPTINIKMPNNLATQGIYAVTVIIDGLTHQGVASIGTRPTVKNNGQCWLEVHLFNFNQDVYGQLAQVTLQHKIRNEEKFKDITTLKLAIAQDIKDAKYFFTQTSL